MTGTIVCVIFVAFFVLVGGESTRLICHHSRQPGTIDCIKQTALLWVISLNKQTIAEINGVQLSETSGDEDGAVYRVELLTSQSVTALTTVYISGFTTKQEVVERVNAFMRNPRPMKANRFTSLDW